MVTPDDAFVTDEEEALLLAQELDAASPPDTREAAILRAIMRAMIPVTAFIRRYVQDYHRREDLAQETWMDFTISVRAGKFHNRGIDPTRYIKGIAHRRIKNYFTRDPRLQYVEVSLPEDDLLEALAISDDIAAVETRFDLDVYFQGALVQLTPEDQRIAHLWRQGWTVAEIAEQTKAWTPRAAAGKVENEYRQAWNKIQRLIKLMQRAAQR